MASNIGQRLKAVEKYLEGEDVFLANYSDGLTDLHLPAQIEQFHAHGKIASCICITPPLSYHIISMGKNDHVEKIEGMSQTNMKVNGGYFIFKKDIFRYIKPGEELVVEPFQRLIKEHQLLGYKHDGYWECMDTLKINSGWMRCMREEMRLGNYGSCAARRGESLRSGVVQTVTHFLF